MLSEGKKLRMSMFCIFIFFFKFRSIGWTHSALTFHSVMRTCEFISATRTIVIFAPFFLALATVLQIHIVVNRIYFIHLFKKKNGSHSAGLGPAFYL